MNVLPTVKGIPVKQTDIVIVGAARTPFGKLLGGLSSLAATRLGSYAIRGALDKSGVHASLIDAVIMGQVLQAGVGQNPAKQAALGAGIPASAHTTTVNKVCLSGLSAIIDAARLLRSGEAEVVVAGGMESMSQSPHLLPGVRGGHKYGPTTMLDHMDHDGLRAADLEISMGSLSEKYADRYPVTREEQDHCSALSHQRALAADFSEEIVKVEVEHRKGKVVVGADEGIRDQVTAKSLGELRPAFEKNGSITAGNASPISDGAAAVVLTTRGKAQEKGWVPLATLRAVGQVAGPDSSLQAQPANALKAALRRQKWEVEELDIIEINEAFAAVVVHSAKELEIDPDSVNLQGGAIAMGHPIGASGARLVVHAAHALANGAEKAGVALCGGGGQGEALLMERN
ncbi:MAG: acetyl-CoA C-acyltransferase [Corynebacterium casei]|uniref:acetyl-CoA C-acyltransferase n=1 Tax=Corynebacterium casei TaxID=160386 RepID=UPI00264976E2|nr:acetyl-CoA C-acyltransferase [Corynebacterium casei]MDN5800009.1 acetyl-CoA C-acyltransferase [Corynebacterium casei]MDN5922457.1 acetyl-CoA C-acyltransferase [Corynebacterium casei]MDN6154889.1 acetyl-CoA C-acyltransferase [Corynebacterium casei]MDN6263609.1 acetyl-CoA C-acyltransferase [Corynebacterium casei]MDN6312639.1 acetyl-CoA C-acyltransferase [Corynebacterium casei]